MKTTRRIIISIVSLMFFLTGCSLVGDKTSARTIKDQSEMPEIVFVYHIEYLSSAYSGEMYDSKNAKCGMTFCDKNGNFYVSENTGICSLSAEELIKEYAAGNLNNQIKLWTMVDSDEVYKNYKKLCKVSKNNKFEMVYPEFGPESIEDVERWYGIYYDKEGNVQTLTYHEANAHGSHYSNDERANEIYEWYIDSFQKTTNIINEADASVNENAPTNDNGLGEQEDLYYKEADGRNVAIDEETGLMYMKNQLLISTNIGTDKSLVEEMADEIGAEIVGYIELTSDYQIEFREDKTIDEMEIIAKDIYRYPFVSYVTLNFYEEIVGEE